jgi:hypothetical protein
LEADRLELVYYWAVTELANSMAVDARQLWIDSIPPTPQGARRASRSWITQLLALMFGYRTRAQRLAIAYYRLNRALRTDTTITLDGESAGQSVSLEQLRDEFEAVVDEIEAEVIGDPTFEMEGEGDFRVEQPQVEFVIDDDDIELEEVVNVDDLIDEADRVAEEQLRELAENLGVANFEKKWDKAEAKTRVPDERKSELKEKAHEDAANRQAAAAMRIMMNAARGLVYDLSDVDLRIVGWVRYSQTGSPCAFCAMLISRKVMYKTARQAQHQGANQEEDKYHDNCKCVAIPIFDKEQFEGSDLYDQNHYYSRLWQDRIAGKYTGDEALAAWRKLLREMERETQTTQAPEAA